MKLLRPVHLRSGKEVHALLRPYRVPVPRARIQLDLPGLAGVDQRDLADALLTGATAPDYWITTGDLPRRITNCFDCGGSRVPTGARARDRRVDAGLPGTRG